MLEKGTMPTPTHHGRPAIAAFVLQDRKRLPVRFAAALSGTMLSR